MSLKDEKKSAIYIEFYFIMVHRSHYYAHLVQRLYSSSCFLHQSQHFMGDLASLEVGEMFNTVWAFTGNSQILSILLLMEKYKVSGKYQTKYPSIHVYSKYIKINLTVLK